MKSIIKYGALAVSVIMVAGALVVPITVAHASASAQTTGQESSCQGRQHTAYFALSVGNGGNAGEA